MNQNEWSTHLVHAVCTAARGNPKRLLELSQALADADTARESLICAGIGSDDCSLGDLVAVVVEREQMRSEQIIGLG